MEKGKINELQVYWLLDDRLKTREAGKVFD